MKSMFRITCILSLLTVSHMVTSIAYADATDDQIAACKQTGGGDCVYKILSDLNARTKGGHVSSCMATNTVRDNCCEISCWGQSKAICVDSRNSGCFPNQQCSCSKVP